MANYNVKVEDVLKKFYSIKSDSDIKGLFEVRNVGSADDEELIWYFFASNNATYNSNGDGCFIRDINQSNSGYIDRLKNAFEKAKKKNKKIFWLVMVFGDGIGLDPKGYDWLASVELLVSVDSITASLSMRKYPTGEGKDNYLKPCCIRYEQDKYFNTTFMSCKNENGEFTDKYMKEYFEHYDNRPHHDLIKVLDKSIIENEVDNNEKYSVAELGDILSYMYTNAEVGMQVASIHVFGIKYGEIIIENGYKPADIIKAASLNESYSTELNKAINTHKCLYSNKYGISIKDNNRIYEKKNDYENTNRMTGGSNILLYGVPGAGKSHKIKEDYCSDEQYIERVVFHPDYTYSDFVGQILPRVDKDDKLKYIFKPGPFTKILKKAYDDREHNYYLIIEELNRGNAPAIFGEIFQLLDRIDEIDEEHDESVIGESEYGISNYDIAKEVYNGDEEHLVKIPSNMYILATMNTADQNVFTLDTAFQRRWEMKQIPNIMKEEHANVKIQDTNIAWGNFVEVINPLIVDINSEMSSSEDKRLGAYFVKKNQFTPEKFSEKVLKYLWDDAFKFSRDSVFNDKYKSLEDLIMDYQNESDGDRLKAVLKQDVYSQMLSKSENKNTDNI